MGLEKEFKYLIISKAVKQYFAYNVGDRTFYKFYKSLVSDTLYKLTFEMTDYDLVVDVRTLDADSFAGYWQEYMQYRSIAQQNYMLTNAALDACILRCYGSHRGCREERKFYRFMADILSFMLKDHRDNLSTDNTQ